MKKISLFLSTILLMVQLVWAQQSLKAPNFRLTGNDGKVYELSQMQGKVVLVNFWATWCPPCRAEIPDFIDVYKRYKDKGFEIVGIALDEEGWNPVRKFMSKAGINYPVVLGNAEVMRAYGGIQSIPTSFLIDKKGNIAAKRIGILRKAELEEAVKKLLAE